VSAETTALDGEYHSSGRSLGSRLLSSQTTCSVPPRTTRNRARRHSAGYWRAWAQGPRRRSRP